MAAEHLIDLSSPSSPDFGVTVDISAFQTGVWPFSGTQLRLIELLADASEPALEALIATAQTRTLAAGEVLFTEGQPARSVFVVRAGSLEVRRARAVAPFTEAQAGEWIGLFGLLAGRRRACHVQAQIASEVTEIDAATLVRLLSAEGPVRDAAKRHFHRRLAQILCGSHPLFSGLSPLDRSQLGAAFHTLDLKAGQNLVLVEEAQSALYVVAHGNLRLTAPELSESTPLARGHLFGVSGGSVALEPLTRLHLLRLAPEDCASPFFTELAGRARARGLFVDRHLFIGDASIPGLA